VTVKVTVSHSLLHVAEAEHDVVPARAILNKPRNATKDKTERNFFISTLPKSASKQQSYLKV